MKDITLFKPIVLRAFLEDMTEKTKATALDLLAIRKLLTFDETGVRIIDLKDIDRESTYYIGSEAVNIYRQLLGLPNISIQRLHVDEILSAVYHFDDLNDIVYLLTCIEERNNRMYRLFHISAPGIIMQNEYRMLQEDVERLQNNREHPDPKLKTICDANPGDAKCSYHDEPRSSLADIDYYLAECLFPEGFQEDEEDIDLSDGEPE